MPSNKSDVGVVIAGYSDQWPLMFEAEAELIRRAFAPEAVRVTPTPRQRDHSSRLWLMITHGGPNNGLTVVTFGAFFVLVLRRVFAGACLALLAGVAAWANQAGPAGDPQYFVEGLACQGGKFGLKLPATLPALLALGPRPRVERVGTQRWEGYTTTHERVLFDGLYVDLIAYSNDPGRYSLAKVTIRSPAWARLAPFAVGEPVDAVRATLGSVAKDDWQLRSIYAGENESVRFETTRAGNVSAIIYECYTG